MNTSEPTAVQMSAQVVMAGVSELLSQGWKIFPTSCQCGGRWAWFRPRETGAMESFGCICHSTDAAIEQLFDRTEMERRDKENRRVSWGDNHQR